MTFNDGCWTRRLAVLTLVTSWLSACATAGSELTPVAVCPPVVDYSKVFQAKAAEELARLTVGSDIAEMLSDYAVMRERARACLGSS